LREIDFEGPHARQIGRFKAFDYFGDGSFYLLDSPGHAIGHMCGLARTTNDPATFILLGGDVCHYAGIFRPSSRLAMPESISPHPCSPMSHQSLCPGHAWEQLQKSRDRGTDESLYDMTFGLDVPLANRTKSMLEDLDCDENVFVIIAHDTTVRDGVPHFPASLNEWKERGWGRDLKWAFLRDLKHCWDSNEVA
jgi:glyoxylase-like metal-dependent hydrolase (beta-lactamase superfamily II)